MKKHLAPRHWVNPTTNGIKWQRVTIDTLLLTALSAAIGYTSAPEHTLIFTLTPPVITLTILTLWRGTQHVKLAVTLLFGIFMLSATALAAAANEHYLLGPTMVTQALLTHLALLATSTLVALFYAKGKPWLTVLLTITGLLATSVISAATGWTILPTLILNITTTALILALRIMLPKTPHAPTTHKPLPHHYLKKLHPYPTTNHTTPNNTHTTIITNKKGQIGVITYYETPTPITRNTVKRHKLKPWKTTLTQTIINHTPLTQTIQAAGQLPTWIKPATIIVTNSTKKSGTTPTIINATTQMGSNIGTITIIPSNAPIHHHIKTTLNNAPPHDLKTINRFKEWLNS